MRFYPKAVFISLVVVLVVVSTSALSNSQLINQRFTSGTFTAKRDVAFSKFSNRSPGGRGNTKLMFEAGGDPTHDSMGGNVWSVLANTDQWIAQTLGQHPRAQPNPYSRKEVSYVCETSRNEPIMAVANIFRQIKESRELGEAHSKAEAALVADVDPDYVPNTLRQTLAVVIPWCDIFESFQRFEAVYQAINEARRAARDYVTDIGYRMDGDWMVSVSLASLHPNYGVDTNTDNYREKEGQEVDLKLDEVNKKRLLARQSPYPTLALELKALPPTENYPASSSPIEGSSRESDPSYMEGPSREDLERLEALFRISSTTKNVCTEEENNEESFFDLLGNVGGIDEVCVDNSLNSAKDWLIQNDPIRYPDASSFISTDAEHVDAAYEVIFTTIALDEKRNLSNDDTFQSYMDPNGHIRSYILMPNFLPLSATSFENFSYEVSNILQKLCLNKPFSVYIFHPEHVLLEKRCPVPTLVFQWNYKKLRP